jgi:TRAP-type C4-dicarboxylate transport system substrate-binding protein
MRPVALLLLLAAPASAEPTVLRMAAIAPDGTAWARELKALARAIETDTGGRVRMKWYLGGIAGDEMESLERVKRGQLDGIGGAIFCQKLSPSLRAVRVAGLFDAFDDGLHVIQRLKPTTDGEFAQSGFVNLGGGGFGIDVVFSRKPIETLDELKATKLFVWNLDPVAHKMLAAMGGKPVALSLEEAARAYDDGRVDGFLVAPTAALAYQWSTQARYVTPLKASFLPACLVIANRAFDALSPELRETVRAAAARFMVRFNDVSRTQEEELLGGLLARQGLKTVPASPALKAAFVAAAAKARDQLGDDLVPHALLQKVTTWIAERHRK